ncbi:cobalamin-binding protein [Shewanella sp. GXUN23E]
MRALLLCLILIGPVTVAEAAAQRIVALSPHAVEMLYAIGAGDSIVATTEHADFPEAAKAIPRIGGYHGIQLEKLLALSPDLVVVWGGGNRQQDIDKMRELGLPLYNSDAKTLDAVADELEQLGQLTGHQTQANALAASLRQQLAQLRQSNQHKPGIKVFYQLWSQPLMTVADGSWIQQILTVCGADNVFAASPSPYPQISLENVLLTSPQVILQSQDAGNIQGIDWSAWPDIPAVRQQQIYQLNADLLHRAGPRVVEGVKATCDVLDKARQAYLQ